MPDNAADQMLIAGVESKVLQHAGVVRQLEPVALNRPTGIRKAFHPAALGRFGQGRHPQSGTDGVPAGAVQLHVHRHVTIADAHQNVRGAGHGSGAGEPPVDDHRNPFAHRGQRRLDVGVPTRLIGQHDCSRRLAQALVDLGFKLIAGVEQLLGGLVDLRSGRRSGGVVVVDGAGALLGRIAAQHR